MVKVTLKTTTPGGTPATIEHESVSKIDVGEGHLYVGGPGLSKTVALYAPGVWASAEVIEDQAGDEG